VSEIDKAGGRFYSPDALAAYCKELKAVLRPDIRVVELDAHINDPAFARATVDAFIASLTGAGRP
jgi:uncharacterized protein (UPF0261 family)